MRVDMHERQKAKRRARRVARKDVVDQLHKLPEFKRGSLGSSPTKRIPDPTATRGESRFINS